MIGYEIDLAFGYPKGIEVVIKTIKIAVQRRQYWVVTLLRIKQT